MKKIDSLLKGRKSIAFVDFEGTQFSHEMIAIGAVLVNLDKNNHVKNMKEPFMRFVKAKNKIGNYVVNLTHITEDTLKKEGISFNDAMQQFKKYLGVKWKKCLFVTYGNHDVRIINQSVAYNFQYPKDICSQFHKNYADFATFIGEFIRDDNGNPLSLVHNCEFFKVKMREPAHDPVSDAVNLANLYDAVLKSPLLIEAEYKKAILHTNHFPAPVKAVLKRLNNGEAVTAEEYNQFVKDYIE